MILFATKDAGPAAYISEIIKALKADYSCLSSDISAKVFDRNGIKNQRVPHDKQDQLDDYAKKECTAKKIDLIVTGASGGACIDKALIQYGAEKGIKVISIIEHWSWYRERFDVNNQLRVPDYILVNDEIAKQEALESGLPLKNIFALGNPILEQRLHEKTSLKDRRIWRKELNIPDKKIITFISECYSTDFLAGSTEYQGFDEFEVLEDILEIMGQGQHLILKLHPQENAEKFESHQAKNISIFSTMDMPSLRVHSDFIIGMGSMLLLEMAAQRRDIISYRPNDLKSFIGNRMGATALVQDRKQLRDILDGRKIINNPGLKKIFEGSTQRVVDFIKGKAS